MTIQIDREMFRDRVKHNFGKRQYGDVACGVYSEEVYDLAQEWFDKEEWKTNIELGTARACRIELKRYIKDRIKVDEEDKAWFIPSFVWIWVAQQVIVLIVRLIIEYYWIDMLQDLPTES